MNPREGMETVITSYYIYINKALRKTKPRKGTETCSSQYHAYSLCCYERQNPERGRTATTKLIKQPQKKAGVI